MTNPERSSPPRELSFRAIVLGLLLSVVMGAANVYLGLKAGMTVSASIPAAVVGMLILRGLFRDGTKLEANQVQTAASAGESLAAGIIFTMPALLLIGFWESFDFWTTTAVAFTGGLLGILLMIPMRRVFVVDNDELPYPEGVACAAVLDAGDRSGAGAESDARSVLVGGVLGAAFKLAVSYLGIVKGVLEGAVATGQRVWFVGADISPALVAVGFIVRLNVAVLIFAGGALGWLVCIPLFPEINALLAAVSPGLVYPIPPADTPVEQAWTLWSRGVRYVGVGAMLVGGVTSIVKVRHGLAHAVRELRSRLGMSTQPRATDDADLSTRAIIGLGLFAVGLVAIIYYRFTGDLGVALLSTVIMGVMAFFFVAVASYIVGLVGNSNSPVSGMTITAVLFTGGLLYLFQYSGMRGMVATLGVAAIVCCTACTSGDVCNDLKTGHLVGASPRRQQIMQILGVSVASLVMAPVLQLLHQAYTIGSRELSAPQAGLFASLVRGFFGDGELPWGLVALGALLGVGIHVFDWVLQRRGARFRAHLMPVAVGIYLPFGLSLPILCGGLMAHWHARAVRDARAPDTALHRGVLFSSGVIAGEALVGVLVAVLLSLGLSTLGVADPLKEILTVGAVVALLGIFWSQTRSSKPS